MPEGDTVWLAAQRLHAALAGQPLTSTDFRLPDLALTDLSGRTVREVVPRGKHLLTRVSPGPADPDPGGLTLHTHFRMDGSWHLYRPGEPWREPAHDVRVVLTTEPAVALGVRLHDVTLLPTSAEETVVGHLGPDLLGPDWDADEAVRRLAADPARAIGPALLDQRNLAGIGNLYKSETLFLRGITPWTPVADTDLPAAVRLAYRLLQANKAHWAQSTTGDTRRGRDKWVFERQGRPCRRCGTTVRRATQTEPGREEQGRLSYWCPSCQRGPAPGRS